MNKQSMLKMALPVIAGLAMALAAPGSASAQASGAEVWARTCGRCHRIQPPTRYDARHWDAIAGHMALNARLTTEEESAVKDFLMGAARKYAQAPAGTEEGTGEVGQLATIDLAVALAAMDTSGEEIFQRQCVACHGASGEGNGPAAVAFNPKPADLTDPTTVGEKTDDELLEVLTKGKGSMPSFSALLKPDELHMVLEYIRSLSHQP